MEPQLGAQNSHMLLEVLSLDRGGQKGEHPQMSASQQGRYVLALLAIAVCLPRSGRLQAHGAQWSRDVVTEKVRRSPGVAWPCR